MAARTTLCQIAARAPAHKKMNGPPRVIHLNVGGTDFPTTQTTLERFPYFAALCKDCHAVFVDRDPTHFRHVLNYMRGGATVPERRQDIAELCIEADFYCLFEYAEQLNAALTARREPTDRLVHAIEQLRGDIVYMR